MASASRTCTAVTICTVIWGSAIQLFHSVMVLLAIEDTSDGGSAESRTLKSYDWARLDRRCVNSSSGDSEMGYRYTVLYRVSTAKPGKIPSSEGVRGPDTLTVGAPGWCFPRTYSLQQHGLVIDYNRKMTHTGSIPCLSQKADPLWSLSLIVATGIFIKIVTCLCTIISKPVGHRETHSRGVIEIGWDARRANHGNERNRTHKQQKKQAKG